MSVTPKNISSGIHVGGSLIKVGELLTLRDLQRISDGLSKANKREITRVQLLLARHSQTPGTKSL